MSSTVDACREHALAAAQDALLQEVSAMGCAELAVTEFEKALTRNGLLVISSEGDETGEGDAT